MNNKLIESLTKHINKIHEIDYMGDFTFGRKSDTKFTPDLPDGEKGHWAKDYHIQSNTGWKDYEPYRFFEFKSMLTNRWASLKFPCTIDFTMFNPKTLDKVSIEITCENEQGPVDMTVITYKAMIKAKPSPRVVYKEKKVGQMTTPQKMAQLIVPNFQKLKNMGYEEYKNQDLDELAQEIVANAENKRGQ